MGKILNIQGQEASLNYNIDPYSLDIKYKVDNDKLLSHDEWIKHQADSSESSEEDSDETDVDKKETKKVYED